MRLLTITVYVLAACMIAAMASGAPGVMSIQGTLNDQNQVPAVDGIYTVTFRIWDAASGGSQVWSETNDSVQVSDGVFDALLGSITPLTPEVFESADRWLSIQMDGDEEMTPRSRIASVAYSMRAAKADTAEVALSVDVGAWNQVPAGISYIDGSVGIGTDNPRERFQIGDRIAIHDGGLKCLGFNWYWDNPGQTDRYLLDGPAARLAFTQDGGLCFQVAPAGDSSSAVPWTTGFNLNNAGRLYTYSMITTDLRGHQGSAGRDALHILASDDNGYGIIAVNKPSLHFWSSSEGKRANLVGGDIYATGRVTCDVLEITGGADLAEPFPISYNLRLQPGSVVIIDEDNPGMLKMSSEPYDHRVAGVISGAEDIQPGIILTAKDVLPDGQRVALTGRVKVLVSLENGPIKPGDLLTTASRPGYAMKASDPNRWPGAVIGKAMSTLTDSSGYVLALVNLH